MSEVKKILGQSNPAATTETTLYTVPDSKGAVISSIVVCNRDGANKTIRISISYGGVATTNKDYIAYDYSMGAHETKEYKIGITLSNADIIRVYASTTDLSFNCFGAEFDQVNVYIEEPL
jgi:hypothetical protein